MNLESRLDTHLWEAVRSSVESRNYTAAILDSVHFLSDVIRERSSLEGDGVALIGAAFGGPTPPLKVNRLQTESERNIQRGVEALLRGIYQSIRNPRSHGKYVDDERDSTAILLFVDYLVRVVGQSKSPFSLTACVARVLDRDFVPKREYADLIVKEIPATKLLGTCLEVFRQRSEGNGRTVRYFFEAALAAMSDEEKAEVAAAISDELRQAEDEQTVLFVLQALPPAAWSTLDEVARLRAEHKLITSVKEGRYSSGLGRCRTGGFGAWISTILDAVALKEDLCSVLVSKLSSTDYEEQEYVFQFFSRSMPSLFQRPPLRLVSAIKRGLCDGDIRFKEAVEAWDDRYLDDEAEPGPWVKPFAKELAEFVQKDVSAPAENFYDDEVPF